MGKNNRPKAIETPEVVPEVVAEVVPEVVAVEVPVVTYKNVVVYDSEDGLTMKVVSAKEARNPRYKPV